MKAKIYSKRLLNSNVTRVISYGTIRGQVHALFRMMPRQQFTHWPKPRIRQGTQPQENTALKLNCMYRILYHQYEEVFFMHTRIDVYDEISKTNAGISR